MTLSTKLSHKPIGIKLYTVYRKQSHCFSVDFRILLKTHNFLGRKKNIQTRQTIKEADAAGCLPSKHV